MATITTRVQGDSPKGSPLTNAEVDNNFINLNTAKYESGDNVSVGSVTASGNITVQSTGIPTLTLFNQDTSVGASQLLSSIVFDNNDDSGSISGNYYIRNYSTDGFAASNLHFYYQRTTGGALLDFFSLRDYGSNGPFGVVINDSSQDLDFRVESDSSTHALFVDGGTSYVGVGEDGPEAPLHITGGATMTGGWKRTLHLDAIFPVLTFQSTYNTDTFGGIGYDTSNDNMDFWVGATTNDVSADGFRALRLKNYEAVFNESGDNVDFRVESGSNSNMFLVDAGSNWVRINQGGGQSTGDKFIVEGSMSLNGFRVIRGQSWSSWGGNTDYYICTMTPAYNGTSAAANIEIFATGGNVSASFRVVAKNAGGTTTPYAYCTGTNTAALQIVGYRDNSDASLIHFYVRPTSGIAYTPRVTVTGHGSLVYNPNAPSAAVDDDYVWGSSSSYTRRVQSGTGMSVSSAYDTAIDLVDGRTASPGSIKYQSFIGWDHYHGRALTFGMEHNDYSLSNRRALLKFNNTVDDVEGYERLTVTGGETVFNEESQNVDFRVESDSFSDAFFVDAGTDKITMFGANPAEAERLALGYIGASTASVPSESGTPTVTFYSTASNASKTILALDGSAAAFSGDNDAGTDYHLDFRACAYLAPPAGNQIEQHIGGRISMSKDKSWNESTGAGAGIYGSLIFYSQGGTYTDPSLKENLRLNRSASIFNDDGDDRDFRVESDSNSNAILLTKQVSDELLFFGANSTNANSSQNAYFNLSDMHFYVAGENRTVAYFNRNAGTGSADGDVIVIRRNNVEAGSISVSSAGTTYNTTSDRRLKENIATITDGTDKLMAMNPVTHTWKAAPEDPPVIGFIAQEMQEIVPEAVVGEHDGEEMMSMDYGRITPVLVAALQDAHKKIAELEARLNLLEGN